MAIFQSIKEAVGSLFDSGGGAQQAFVSGRSYVGRKNKRAQLEAQKEVPALFRVTSKIAWDFAAVEWTYKDAETGEPIDEDTPFIKSLSNPNPELTLTQVRALSMQYRDVVGEFIHVMIPTEDEDGQPKLEFWPIPPTDAKHEGDTWSIDHGGARYKVPEEAIIHEKMPDLQDPYGRGYGYGGVLSDELMTIEHASEFTANQFANSARPDIIVNLDGGGESAIEQFKQMWTQKYGGPKNAGKPLVSGGDGGLSIEKLTPPIEDTKVQEIKQRSVEEVAETFGVPPIKLGRVEDSNRNTAVLEEKVYADNVQRPRLTQWKRMVEEDIAPLFDRQVVAEFEDPGPDDIEKLLQLLDKFPESVLVNEAREVANLPPREDGDHYLRPPETKLREVQASEVESETQESKALESGCSCCGDDKTWEMKILDEGVEVSEVKEIESDLKKKIDKQPEDVPEEARELAEQLEADQIRTELEEQYRGELETGIAQEAQFYNLDKEEMFTILNPFVTDEVQRFGSDKVVGINDTTKKQITNIVAEAVKDGKNPRAIADDIDQYVEQIIPNRGETIARTEMLRARNSAGFKTQQASGLFQKREWVTSLDGRARASHLDLNGETAQYDDVFTIAGASAKYPGDFDVPELDINCRCTTMPLADELSQLSADIPVVKKAGSKDEVRKAVWHRFDKSLQDMERRFEDVAKATLTRQIQEHIIPNVEDILSRG